MPPLLSIIIPTYNRPEQLLATLRFLQARAIRLPIFVADGSDENFAPQNRECTKLGDNISYVHSPAGSGEGPWQNYRRRISEVLNAVATPYVVYCADDDLLIIENAVKAAKFLETHVDYIGCHGTYLHYRTVDDNSGSRARPMTAPRSTATKPPAAWFSYSHAMRRFSTQCSGPRPSAC